MAAEAISSARATGATSARREAVDLVSTRAQPPQRRDFLPVINAQSATPTGVMRDC
jgi:hypothetical protein